MLSACFLDKIRDPKGCMHEYLDGGKYAWGATTQAHADLADAMANNDPSESIIGCATEYLNKCRCSLEAASGESHHPPECPTVPPPPFPSWWPH